MLEYIENGKITLIASTTENPYFYVYPAIISRCAVFEFKSVERDQLKLAVSSALSLLEEEVGEKISVTDGSGEGIAIPALARLDYVVM